jgi:dipeptidyl aminopeptidase/acylaminoacyl peptidase
MKVTTLRAFVLATIFALAASAQSKPTVKPADYGKWETPGASTLSPDGKWIAYEIRRVDGNNELRVSAATGGKPTTIAVCAGAAYSFDSKWLACGSTVTEAEAERLKKASRPAAQNKLQILELASGTITTVDTVQSFAFSGDGDFIAFRRYPPTAANNNNAPAAGGGRGGRGGGGRGGADNAGDTERDPSGSTLTVRNLATGVDMTFGNVTGFSWQENGTNLAMTVGVEGRVGNAVQVYDAKTGTIKVLDNGPAVFSALTWRKDSSDLAALRSVKNDGYEGESHIALSWKNLGDKKSTKIDPPQRIVGSRAPTWSEDGETIFVGLAPWQKKIDNKKSDDDPSTVEVWHWKDENVISEQKLTANRDRDRNVTAAWSIAAGKLTALSTNDHEDVRLPKRGNRALALDGTPYVTDSMFGRRFDDVYKVDMTTGARSQIAKHMIPPVDFSPGGKYALNFKDGQFFAYDLESGTNKNISADAKSVSGFTNKENDYPVAQKPPYGIAGWTKDDKSVIVYDAYDLWEMFPDGTKPRKLTDGAADEVRHRYVRISPEGGGGRGGRGGGGGNNDWIDLSKPVYLSLEGRWSKKTGYARLENGKVDRAMLVEKGVRGLEKAKSADVFAYSQGAWNESPNLFVAGADLKTAAKVSDTNPFASQYAWGKAELVDYKNSHNDRLQAALYYPANYEAGKKYPMIVQIYEIESNQLHNWGAPSERNTYNATVWTQNGYFVLRPDITFKPRQPGISALDCVTSAVKAVLAKGMVDPKKLGLVGHSWGGYETTFILTQTDMFAAGAAGGPLTNLSSSVGEIYWNNGVPETGHVEVGQERMEVPLYEDPQAYIRNSSVFFANKLAAPLLLSVGDKDGASDWHQDIELYNSARRAGKNVVMLVYEGENHSVAQKANQLDYHRRINAWFDHYVKGEPAEPWIKEGVSVLKREQELKKSPASGDRATPTGGQN